MEIKDPFSASRMEEIKMEFPAKIDLDNTIGKIKNNNYTDSDTDKIINWCSKINLLYVYEPNSIVPMYRCSRINDEIKRNINNPNTFSYPPPQYCKIGRCNMPNEPVLYLSIDEYTPFFEIYANVGEKIYLSEWSFEPKNKVFEKRLFFSPSFFNDKYSYATIFALSTEENVKKLFKSLSNDDKSNLFYFLEKMNEIIRLKSSDYYTLTSKLCADTFNGFNTENAGRVNIDIISYPSVSTNLESINFAFRTKVVDDGIVSLKKVYKVLITEITDKEIKCNLLKIGIKEKDKINWHEPPISL